MFYSLRSETAGSFWYEEKNKGFDQVFKLIKGNCLLEMKLKNAFEIALLLLRQW